MAAKNKRYMPSVPDDLEADVVKINSGVKNGRCCESK